MPDLSTAVTQLQPTGVMSRRYGSFAGKTPAEIIAAQAAAIVQVPARAAVVRVPWRAAVVQVSAPARIIRVKGLPS